MLWWVAETQPELLTCEHANIVVSTLSAARPTAQWERAIALLESMPSLGLTPDSYTYSAAIAACSRAGEVERALAVFRQCCASEDGPNAVVFNAVLLACQRAGAKWSPQLLAIFAAMSAHGVPSGPRVDKMRYEGRYL